MPAELTQQELEDVLASKDEVNKSTIDNGATSTEIQYLSRLYLATHIEKYKDGALMVFATFSKHNIPMVVGLNSGPVLKVTIHISPTMTTQW